MSTEHDGGLFSLELPLMYIEPSRTLLQVSASFDELSALERLQHRVQETGAVAKTVYAYYQPDRGKYLGLLTIDTTGTGKDTSALTQQLSGIPGVNIMQASPSESSLAAAERSTLQVAGTPMVVMAREVLGGAFQQFSQHSQPGAVYETGIQMGKLAASAVPALLDRLGMPLTLDLLRSRVSDLQVFGWAEVRRVDVAESLEGNLELSQTFESAPWKGTATRPTCDFIRGFTTGVFSFAYNRGFTSEETACQGRGDPLCRISFRPTA